MSRLTLDRETRTMPPAPAAPATLTGCIACRADGKVAD
jgi:hypothetical protein